VHIAYYSFAESDCCLLSMLAYVTAAIKARARTAICRDRVGVFRKDL